MLRLKDWSGVNQWEFLLHCKLPHFAWRSPKTDWRICWLASSTNMKEHNCWRTQVASGNQLCGWNLKTSQYSFFPRLISFEKNSFRMPLQPYMQKKFILLDSQTNSLHNKNQMICLKKIIWSTISRGAGLAFKRSAATAVKVLKVALTYLPWKLVKKVLQVCCIFQSSNTNRDCSTKKV